MKSNARLTLSLLFLLLTAASLANASDNKRSGFWFGLGVGLESITSYEIGIPDHHRRFGFQGSLDLGVGVSDQVLLLLSGHLTTNSKPDPPYDKVVWLEPAVIVRYYFKPSVPSFYLFAGPAAGIGTGLTRYEEVIGAGGIGVTAGGGYQFERHLQIQVGILRATELGDATFTSIHTSLNLVFY